MDECCVLSILGAVLFFLVLFTVVPLALGWLVVHALAVLGYGPGAASLSGYYIVGLAIVLAGIACGGINIRFGHGGE